MKQNNHSTSSNTFILYYLLPVILLMTLIGGHFWIKSKEQRRIKKNLSHLIETLSFDSPLSMIASASTAQSIIKSLRPDAEIDPGYPFDPVSGRREVAQLFQLIHQHLEKLQLEIEGMEITLLPDRQKANVELTLKATATYNAGKEEEYREYQIDYLKKEGQWLISKAQPRQTIQKHPL